MPPQASNGYWKKGDKDPEAGVPFRHARDRARLLAREIRGDECRDVLMILIEKRPNEVLDALIEYMGDE